MVFTSKSSGNNSQYKWDGVELNIKKCEGLPLVVTSVFRNVYLVKEKVTKISPSTLTFLVVGGSRPISS